MANAEARPSPGPAPIALPILTRTRRGDVWRRLARNELTVAGAIILALVAVAALFAPYLSPQDPLAMNPTQLLQPPSAEHVMGTDELGRDVLSRVIWGARISLYVGIVSVTMAVAIGVTL